MQLVLHTGVHYTEQDRLAQTLLRNEDVFAQGRVAMPVPDIYRSLMRDTLNAMHRAPVAEDARDVLLDAILGSSEPDRLILSDPNFFRTPGTAVQKGAIPPPWCRSCIAWLPTPKNRSFGAGGGRKICAGPSC